MVLGNFNFGFSIPKLFKQCTFEVVFQIEKSLAGFFLIYLFISGIYLPLFAGAGVDAVEFILPILLDMTPIFGVITLAVPLLLQTRVHILGSLSS